MYGGFGLRNSGKQKDRMIFECKIELVLVINTFNK